MSLSPVVRTHAHPCRTCSVQRSFCPLSAGLLPVFDGLKTSVLLRKGEMVFREGDRCHSVYVVCTGSIKLYNESGEGRVLLLRFAYPGELLGMAEALLGRAPYECSAVAAEPMVVSSIPSETFVRFISSYPEAGCRLTRALSEQYQAAHRETKFLAFGETTTVRLARLLLEWSAQRGTPLEDGMHIASLVTHNELAQSIGSTRETITRVLGRLSHTGVVERTPGEFVIHDEQELTRLAHTQRRT